MATIPLVDLDAQYRTLKPEIEAAVLRGLSSYDLFLEGAGGPPGQSHCAIRVREGGDNHG